ncbi:MAG: adenylyl-sulfate kinase [Halobacteriota archaeon]
MSKLKILVCGKGGSGKSTLAALLAKSMENHGYNVLVIDGDESNFGLHSQLGMNLPIEYMENFGGKSELVNLMKNLRKEDGTIEIFDRKIGTEDIPSPFFDQKNRIKLIAVGKIHNFGEGCACSINALSKALLCNIELKEGEIVIADMDAGIEHFGRGVTKCSDIILTVVDPSYESIKLAKKIEELGKSIGMPVYFVLNKVREEDKDILLDSLESDRVIGIINENRKIFRSCLRGDELIVHTKEVEELSKLLVSKSEV